MKTYIKFIIIIFFKSLLFVSSIIFSLVFILNLLSELEFFKDIKVDNYFPMLLSILNSPDLLFQMFPFIFLITTQLFFIKLFTNNEIEILKYSGLKNSKILGVLLLSSFFTGIIISTLFYNLSSNLKNVYLELKNTYTSDDKYLAVITNNGLWIKDNVNNNINIINASKIDDRFLLNASITELDTQFDVKRHIESEKIDISNKNWVVDKPTVYLGNEKEIKNYINFYSNFDYERIQSLFSNLSSLSIIELFELKKNYALLNLSTTEVGIQIHKILSYPLYLCLMCFLAAIIMFNTKQFKSNTFKISVGLFFSVLIYYMNNFSYALGGTERISLFLSVLLPLLILTIINSLMLYKVNEK